MNMDCCIIKDENDPLPHVLPIKFPSCLQMLLQVHEKEQHLSVAIDTNSKHCVETSFISECTNRRNSIFVEVHRDILWIVFWDPALIS